MPKGKRRVFSREFKLSAVKRMVAGGGAADAIGAARPSPRRQGDLAVGGMCVWGGVTRAGYSRHGKVSAPRKKERVGRDRTRGVARPNRRYGYRRIAAQLRRDGLV